MDLAHSSAPEYIHALIKTPDQFYDKVRETTEKLSNE
jgi:hypothetical protein